MDLLGLISARFPPFSSDLPFGNVDLDARVARVDFVPNVVRPAPTFSFGSVEDANFCEPSSGLGLLSLLEV